MQRPPTAPDASTSANRFPAAARRRAAAMPAAPAPTMTTSRPPERAVACGAGPDFALGGAARADGAVMAAQAARNKRRFNRFMVGNLANLRASMQGAGAA